MLRIPESPWTHLTDLIDSLDIETIPPDLISAYVLTTLDEFGDPLETTLLPDEYWKKWGVYETSQDRQHLVKAGVVELSIILNLAAAQKRIENIATSILFLGKIPPLENL